MQERHNNRQQYFNELAETSRRYFIPYLQETITIKPKTTVLEIGCGDGGNLLPLAQMGCKVKGIDLSVARVEQAKRSFEDAGCHGDFAAINLFELESNETYDVVLVHDVIEHITDKETMLLRLKRFIAPHGVLFMGFPAWHMPFGGHQQICRSKIISHFPFLHLLPKSIYRFVLQKAGESPNGVNELLDIKSCATTIELFERLCRKCHYTISDRLLWFINPHYEAKFGLRPRKLFSVIGSIPYVRNYFTTSCFYILVSN